MKFKCTYSRDNDEVFTVGQIYESEFSYTDNHGDNWYQAKNNAGINSKILLDGWFWKFEIVDEEEEAEKMLTGLEAIELMKQGKVVVDATGEYHFKIIDGNVYYKYYTKDDDEYAVDCAFEFSTTYKEYIEPISSTGWHDAGKSMDFFWIDGTGVDDERYRFEDEYPDDNRFSTKEKAEEINFKQTLFRKLQRFSDENGGLDIDWSDIDQTKYCIRYHHEYEKLSADYWWASQEFGQVYFISEEIAKQAIELFHDDLIKYFTM